MAVKDMTNPLFLHYTYYHCSKSRRPLCRQKSITRRGLEKIICDRLARIGISKQFKDWAIKHLHKLHAQETQSHEETLQSQQHAYRACLGQLEGLVGLKTSLSNRDGSLLSDAEYIERRGCLLKEKSALETAMQEIGLRMAQALKLSEQTFGFACLVLERFTKGSANTQKEILATMSSNLTLKDKKLLIEARKPFVILGDSLNPERPTKSPIEPKNLPIPQGRKIHSVFQRPQLRGERDDVRTYIQKAEHTAALIYAHFKKEFGMPNKN